MKALIRPATPLDLPALLAIERQSFSDPHWRATDFLRDPCSVAEISGRVVGLFVWRETFPGDQTSPPEREILNVAIAPDFRRTGVASALLAHELQPPAHYFLEVRESNLAAQQLYRRFGFVEIAVRPNYYQDPQEGAIVMKMKWC